MGEAEEDSGGAEDDAEEDIEETGGRSLRFTRVGSFHSHTGAEREHEGASGGKRNDDAGELSDFHRKFP